MNSRLAQIVASSIGPDGKPNRQKIFDDLSVSPEAPESFFVDALLGYEEGIQRLNQFVQNLQAASATANSEQLSAFQALIAEHKKALADDAVQRNRWLAVAVCVPIGVSLILLGAFWYFLIYPR